MRKSRSSLFLMELIIAIFFFSLAAAVVLKLFASAGENGKKTEALNCAVQYSVNAGELFYEYGSDFESKTGLLTDSLPDDYSISLDFSGDDEFIYLDYSFYTVGEAEPVYTMQYKQYVPRVK